MSALSGGQMLLRCGLLAGSVNLPSSHLSHPACRRLYAVMDELSGGIV